MGDRLGKPLLIRYVDDKGEETQRTVVPFSLIDWRGRQGIWAFCLMRQSMRWFYFESILGCDPIEVSASIPGELEILHAAVTANGPTREAIARGIDWLRDIRLWGGA